MIVIQALMSYCGLMRPYGLVMVNYTGTVMTNGYDREMDNRHVLRISALLHLWFNGKLLQRGRIAELQRTSESYIIC